MRNSNSEMFIKAACFLLAAFGFAQTALAGICIEHPPDTVLFSKSEAVFIGRVLSVKRFYGLKRTDENWNLKYKIVEFEVQNAYKGVEAENKIQAVMSYGDIDWPDLKPKKSEQW